jgi:hypothetical protein
MSSLNKPVRLQSWIPPSFALTTATDVFCIEVSISDPDVVEFISTGAIEATVSTKEASLVFAGLMGEKTLRNQIDVAVSVPANLKADPDRVDVATKVVVHCHGVFLLRGGNRVCVVAGLAKPSSQDAWVGAGLKAEADTLLREHQSKVAEFEEEIERQKQKSTEFWASHSEMKGAKAARDLEMIHIGSKEINQRPKLTAVGLLPLLPRAATFAVPPSGDPEKIVRSAVTAIAASTFAPSRDGTYAGILPSPAGRRARLAGSDQGNFLI